MRCASRYVAGVAVAAVAPLSLRTTRRAASAWDASGRLDASGDDAPLWRPRVRTELDTARSKLTAVDGFLPRDSAVATSPRMAWWNCSRCGNAYEARIALRNNPQADEGCPHCALNGATLACAAPEVAAEWHPTRNVHIASLTPETAPSDSDARVWWRCSGCRNEYLASVSSRVSGTVSCTVCSTKAAKTPAGGALLSDYPSLLAECTAPDAAALSADSAQAVRWQCSGCATTFAETVRNRCRMGARCPECAGTRGTMFRSLRTQRPDVFREIYTPDVTWFASKVAMNGITTQSSAVLPFRCSRCKHVYRMPVRERCVAPIPCPRCASLALERRVDMATGQRPPRPQGGADSGMRVDTGTRYGKHVAISPDTRQRGDRSMRS